MGDVGIFYVRLVALRSFDTFLFGIILPFWYAVPKKSGNPPPHTLKRISAHERFMSTAEDDVDGIMREETRSRSE
jgi:hypothetical protein